MKEILEKLDRALKSSEAEIQFGPEFIKQLYNSRFEKQDKERCVKAITAFLENHQTPSLNFEFLTGGDNANHCSIRGSQDLRVILAVDSTKKARFLFANMGQHDEMYSWNKERDGKSDFNDKRNQVSITEKGASPARRIENTLNDALSGKFDSWQLFLPENMKKIWLLGSLTVPHVYAVQLERENQCLHCTVPKRSRKDRSKEKYFSPLSAAHWLTT